MKRQLLFLVCLVTPFLLKAQSPKFHDPINYEKGLSGYTIDNQLNIFGVTTKAAGIVKNPKKDNVNSSDSVFMIVTHPGDETWAGCAVVLKDSFQMGVPGGCDSVVVVKVFKQVKTNFLLKFENHSGIKTADGFEFTNKTTGAWETDTVVYTGYQGVWFNVLTIIPDYVGAKGDRTQNDTTYIDDITFKKLAETAIRTNSVASFSVYPNPTTDLLKLNGVSNITKVEINDILGRNIKSVIVSNNSVSVSDLHSGVYFISVSSNNKQYVTKFIKK